ncbi:hypothetical protein HFP72_20125 [Nocardiopsis sp. ARC36]
MSRTLGKGRLDPGAQQRILTRIGMRIFDVAPDGWTRLVHRIAVDDNDAPGITFPAAFGFTDDLARFPRDEENIPDRFRERLVEEAEERATE